MDGVPITNLQIIFAISAGARSFPSSPTRRAGHQRYDISWLISQMRRGNLLSYAYNTALFNIASREKTRARAAEALGKSGNPLAIEQLVRPWRMQAHACDEALHALWAKADQKAQPEPLLRELLDGSSDIRSEAAEALGRLEIYRADPLIDALDDDDLRVAHQCHSRFGQHTQRRSARAVILALWQRL